MLSMVNNDVPNVTLISSIVKSHRGKLYFALLFLTSAPLYVQQNRLADKYLQAIRDVDHRVTSTERPKEVRPSLSFYEGMTQEEVDAHRTQRPQNYSTWFVEGTDKLRMNADANETGNVMDFAIVGFPKCGTTTMVANLGYVAPLDAGDICTPVHNTVYYAYKNWPNEMGEEKLLRGTKCPQMDVVMWSRHLPRTLLIVGIRHPVGWFQSFWNMQVANFPGNFDNITPYNLSQHCQTTGKGCGMFRPCGKGWVLCVHRSRFHLTLAGFGKTALTDEERQWLSPSDPDGGVHLRNRDIRNPVFIYEQNELNEDDLWTDLAAYLRTPSIPHDLYRSSHGATQSRGEKLKIDLCNPEYDNLRAQMMVIAHEMSVWFLNYLVPVAEKQPKDAGSQPNNAQSQSNGDNGGVIIPNTARFRAILTNYTLDPCGRLVRSKNGTYVLP